MTALVRSDIFRDQSSAGSTNAFDCTGGNLLVVKIAYTGSSGVTLGGTPTVGGNAMTQRYGQDGFQNHVHIYYYVNPPAGSQNIVTAGNGSFPETIVAELYSSSGVPELPVAKTSLLATDSVSVASGGTSDLVSSFLMVGANVSAAAATAPVSDHIADSAGGLAINAGTRAGTGGSDTVEYSSINTSAGNRLVAFNIPDAGAASATVVSIDSDNAVNQYQQNAVIALSDFTETITSVTLNGVACPIIEADTADNQIAVDIPGTLATGSYDLVVSGATETATLSAVSYTQTHEYTAPYGLVDSNSLFANQALTENSYFRIVSGPTNGTLDAAGAESGNLWGNDISDIYTPDGGFSGDDNVTLEALYSDGTTAQWTVTITVVDAVVVEPWPYPEDTPSIPITWSWGKRHPLTNTRVRMFKRGG